MQKSKYHAKRIKTLDGDFDSKKEYNRWCDLCLMQKAGIITDLQRQVKFELIPAQKEGKKTIERAAYYVADFVYNKDGRRVVEDTKGVKTRDYILKRKIMLWRYGVKIHEI